MTDRGTAVSLTYSPADDLDGIDAATRALRDLMIALGAPAESLIAEICMSCDGCDTVTDHRPTAAEALALALSLGWEHTPGEGDYCPCCTRKDN